MKNEIGYLIYCLFAEELIERASIKASQIENTENRTKFLAWVSTLNDELDAYVATFTEKDELKREVGKTIWKFIRKEAATKAKEYARS